MVNPQVLATAGLDLFAALAGAAVGLVAWRRRPAPASTAFVVLAGAIAWWCFWGPAGQLAADLAARYTAVRLAWLGAAVAPTAYLVVALQYAGHESAWPPRRLALLAIEPALTVLAVWTNDWLGLMWRQIWLNTDGPVPYFDGVRGPWYWVHAVYIDLLLIVAVARLGQVVFGSWHGLYRSQATLLLAGAIVPWLAIIIDLAGLSPIGPEITPVAFGATAVLWGASLFRRGFLEVMPVAEAGVLDGLQDGLIVLDRRERVVEVNLAARRLMAASDGEVVGQPLARVLPPLAVPAGPELLLQVDGRARSFEVRPAPLRDRHGREVGRIVVLTETTDRRRADELERSRELILQAEERLRRDIAEQLHGGVQTKLLLAWYRLEECRRLLVSDPARAAELLEQLGQEIDAIREQDVRRVSHRLHPSVIQVGLVPALETLAAGYAGRLDVELRVDDRLAALDDPLANRLPEVVRLGVYRIVEEALANAQRHGQARRAVVELACADGGLELTVRDDGRGFVPAQAAPGLGLNAVAARVGQLGGEWRLDSAPGQGTRLVARLCLAEPREPATPGR
jgi:signal transduction histidine kinase